MKKVWLLRVLVITVLLGASAIAAALHDDIMSFPECKYCGMKRKLFSHSRMMVYHNNGEAVGVCSLNCASIDYIRRVDDSPESMKVGDYNSKALIDAEKAYWVLGGDRPGVMTNRAKWAFRKKSDAMLFIGLHGGELINFEDAIKASYVDIFDDMMRLKVMKREYSRARVADSSRSKME